MIALLRLFRTTTQRRSPPKWVAASLAIASLAIANIAIASLANIAIASLAVVKA